MNPVTGPDFDSHELIPAIAQDAETGDVLMMAWMNRQSWQETNASIEALVKAGIVRHAHDGMRLLADGELKTKLTIECTFASKAALAAELGLEVSLCGTKADGGKF